MNDQKVEAVAKQMKLGDEQKKLLALTKYVDLSDEEIDASTIIAEDDKMVIKTSRVILSMLKGFVDIAQQVESSMVELEESIPMTLEEMFAGEPTDERCIEICKYCNLSAAKIDALTDCTDEEKAYIKKERETLRQIKAIVGQSSAMTNPLAVLEANFGGQ